VLQTLQHAIELAGQDADLIEPLRFAHTGGKVAGIQGPGRAGQLLERCQTTVEREGHQRAAHQQAEDRSERQWRQRAQVLVQDGLQRADDLEATDLIAEKSHRCTEPPSAA